MDNFWEKHGWEKEDKHLSALKSSAFRCSFPLTPPENAYEKIAELVANEYLNRRFGRYGYAENKKGEIDFYSPSHWAVEVKWAPIVQNLSRLYKEIRAPQKLVWSQSNFLQGLSII